MLQAIYASDVIVVASLFILYNEPTDAQLIDKFSQSSYMFRHYFVILVELVVITMLLHKYLCNLANLNKF